MWNCSNGTPALWNVPISHHFTRLDSSKKAGALTRPLCANAYVQVFLAKLNPALQFRQQGDHSPPISFDRIFQDYTNMGSIQGSHCAVHNPMVFKYWRQRSLLLVLTNIRLHYHGQDQMTNYKTDTAVSFRINAVCFLWWVIMETCMYFLVCSSCLKFISP